MIGWGSIHIFKWTRYGRDTQEAEGKGLIGLLLQRVLHTGWQQSGSFKASYWEAHILVVPTEGRYIWAYKPLSAISDHYFSSPSLRNIVFTTPIANKAPP